MKKVMKGEWWRKELTVHSDHDNNRKQFCRKKTEMEDLKIIVEKYTQRYDYEQKDIFMMTSGVASLSSRVSAVHKESWDCLTARISSKESNLEECRFLNTYAYICTWLTWNISQ